MKRINRDVLGKILVLMGLSVFYMFIILTGKVNEYVSPRIIIFIEISIFLMVMISVFLILKTLHVKVKRKGRISPYLVYIIPLLMAFIIPINVTGSSLISDKNLNLTQASSPKSNSLKPSSSAIIKFLQSGSMTGEKSMKYDGDTIVIDNGNFVYSVEQISNNADKYNGKKVQITGFIYRDKNFDSDKFVLARFMMVCCTADLQVVGIMCSSSQAVSLKNDSWFNLKGTIHESTYQGKKDSEIEVNSAESTEKPGDGYVYPY